MYNSLSKSADGLICFNLVEFRLFLLVKHIYNKLPDDNLDFLEFSELLHNID